MQWEVSQSGLAVAGAKGTDVNIIIFQIAIVIAQNDAVFVTIIQSKKGDGFQAFVQGKFNVHTKWSQPLHPNPSKSKSMQKYSSIIFKW